MSIDLEGRAGLVTRAAGGIGRASAIAFGRAGASVIVADLESAREGPRRDRRSRRSPRPLSRSCQVGDDFP
jgi:NAD(P)-dependent dehydrogenase (short-subunit alcohol dehydrogenase family)